MQASLWLHTSLSGACSREAQPLAMLVPTTMPLLLLLLLQLVVLCRA